MNDDDTYGFQARADELSERQQPPPDEPPATPEAYPVGQHDYSRELLINPRSKTDAEHVRATSLYSWYRREIDDRIADVLRNPSYDHFNAVSAILLQYRDAFTHAHVWSPRARHS